MKKNCLLCNNEFKTKPSHYEMRKYCSKKCMDVARQTFELRNCVICHSIFKYQESSKKSGSIGKYCSLKCKGKNHKVGEEATNVKLTTDQVIDIKKQLLNGSRIIDLAKKYNRGTSTIRAIKINRTWKHIII